MHCERVVAYETDRSDTLRVVHDAYSMPARTRDTDVSGVGVITRIREYALVCSYDCMCAVATDPAWTHVSELHPTWLRTAPPFVLVGDEPIVPKFTCPFGFPYEINATKRTTYVCLDDLPEAP